MVVSDLRDHPVDDGFYTKRGKGTGHDPGGGDGDVRAFDEFGVRGHIRGFSSKYKDHAVRLFAMWENQVRKVGLFAAEI